jgi:hypothetical protein
MDQRRDVTRTDTIKKSHADKAVRHMKATTTVALLAGLGMNLCYTIQTALKDPAVVLKSPLFLRFPSVHGFGANKGC